MRTRIL
jgi:hypothetical protein